MSVHIVMLRLKRNNKIHTTNQGKWQNIVHKLLFKEQGN